MLPKAPIRLVLLFAFVAIATGCTMKDSGGGRAVNFNPFSSSSFVERDISNSTPDGVPLDCRTK